MNIEKVKEIKKALECCTNPVYCEKECPYHIYERHLECINELAKDSLTLINELESENEKLKQHKRELQGGQQDLTKQIAELEKENKSLYDSYHKGYKVGYEYGKQDAVSSDRAENDSCTSETTQSDYRLKQFAERLKEKVIRPCDLYDCVTVDDIDETLNEFIK